MRYTFFRNHATKVVAVVSGLVSAYAVAQENILSIAMDESGNMEIISKNISENITNTTISIIEIMQEEEITPHFLLALSATAIFIFAVKKFYDNLHQKSRAMMVSFRNENENIRNEINTLQVLEEELNDWYQREMPILAEDNNYVAEDDTPSEYICPITHEVLRDPVYIEEDKRSYERSSLQRWYEQSGGYCPINRECKMTNPNTLSSNVDLKNKIDAYIEERRRKFSLSPKR